MKDTGSSWSWMFNLQSSILPCLYNRVSFWYPVGIIFCAHSVAILRSHFKRMIDLRYICTPLWALKSISTWSEIYSSFTWGAQSTLSPARMTKPQQFGQALDLRKQEDCRRWRMRIPAQDPVPPQQLYWHSTSCERCKVAIAWDRVYLLKAIIQ